MSKNSSKRSVGLSTPRRSLRSRSSASDVSLRSPPPRGSLLSDNTEIDVPRRKSWWKKIDRNSINIREVFGDKGGDDENFNIENIIQTEVGSSHPVPEKHKVNTEDLSNASDNESLGSIQIPQRKLFSQRHTQAANEAPQKVPKLPATLMNVAPMTDSSANESLGSVQIPQRKLFNHKPNRQPNKFQVSRRESVKKNTIDNDKTLTPSQGKKTRDLFQNNKHTSKKNTFPVSIANSIHATNITNVTTKTVDGSVTMVKEKKTLFGRKQTKHAAFPVSIMSESEEESIRIQQKLGALKKNPPLMTRSRRISNVSRSNKRTHSPGSICSETMELENWNLLPSSTMVGDDMITSTPAKKLCRQIFFDNSEQRMSEQEKSVNGERNANVSEIAQNASEVMEVDNYEQKNKNKTVPERQSEASNQSKQHNKSKINKNNSKFLKQTDNIDNKSKDDIAATSSNKTDNQNNRNGSQTYIEHKQDEKSQYGHSISKKVKTNLNIDEKNGDKPPNTYERNKSSQYNINKSDEANHDIENTSKQLRKISQNKNTTLIQNNSKENEQLKLNINKNGTKASKITENDNAIELEAELGNNKENAVESEIEQGVNRQSCVHPGIQHTENKDSEVEYEKDQNCDEEPVIQKGHEENAEHFGVEQTKSHESKENELQTENTEQNGSNKKPEDSEEEQEDNREEVEGSDEKNKENQDDTEKSILQDGSQGESEASDKENEVSEIVQSENEEDPSELEQDNDEAAHESELENDEASQESELENDKVTHNSELENDEAGHESVSENDEASQEEELENDEAAQQSDLENDEAVQESELEIDEAARESELEIDEAVRESELENGEDVQESELEKEDENLTSDEETEVRKENSASSDNEEDNGNKESNSSSNGEMDGTDRSERVSKRFSKSNEEFSQNTKHCSEIEIEAVRHAQSYNINYTDREPRSSSEGSGWNSHTTAYVHRAEMTMNARKSLRTLVLDKAAKSRPSSKPIDISMDIDDHDFVRPSLPIRVTFANNSPVNSSIDSPKMSQTKLDQFVKKIARENLQCQQKMQEKVKNSIKKPRSNPNFEGSFFDSKSSDKKRKEVKSANKKTSENNKLNVMLDGVVYKPPKLYKPPKAPWITVNLYKFLNSKLQERYGTETRNQSERFVQLLFEIYKHCVKRTTDVRPAIQTLKRKMALLGIVTTYDEFYFFVDRFMPREFRIKTIPDIANGLPLNDLASPIIPPSAVR